MKYTFYPPEYLKNKVDCYTEDRYHPFVQAHDTTIVHFARLTDKTHVCEMVARAQMAILNPSQDSANFQTGRLPTAKDVEVKFSPNYISLEISGPELPNLSFYDLPGVISGTTKDPNDGWVIGLVEELVREYISDESAIVLLAIPLEHDLEHSFTSRLIKEEEANSRCVGILTKPDRMADGTPVSSLIEVLSGDALSCGHGWFVTKQPNQKQQLTHAEARSHEEMFFERQAPWNKELSKFKHRFGGKNIQDALSGLLFEGITSS